MEQKLLVLALGTTGGEVGLIFKQQMAQRTVNGFYYKVLCLDTSDQLRRSGRISPNEFVHLMTEEHYMENVIAASSAESETELHNMIYPDFPPPLSTANGAGNIRYSAAVLLALPSMQYVIRNTLSTLIGQLAEQGDTKSRDISFAIVISAVGATGSGAISLLIPLILGAAQHAGIVKPSIDVFILHPVLSVSDPLLLANAEALYIELAAMQNAPEHNRYTGRKVILGSGGQAHTITRLEELERTAATLIRLTTDARFGITRPYWDALPNRGVLRGQEFHTLLPTHLSSATPVTIGLANLSRQVIEVDTAQLTSRLVFDTRRGDDEPPHVNTALSYFNFLRGSNPEESYRLLLDSLTESIHSQLDSFSRNESSLRAFNNAQKADNLLVQYRRDLEQIEEERSKIQPQARGLFNQLQEALKSERIKYIMAGISLTQLRNDYKEIIGRIRKLQEAANRVIISSPISELQLQQLLNDVARGRGQAVNKTLYAIQENLSSKCRAAAVQIASHFLNSLDEECERVVQRVETFISEATERFKNKSGWYTNATSLQVYNDNSLYISALDSKQDIDEYYHHVSIFAQSGAQQNLFSDAAQSDPMAPFRHELEQKDLVKHFFDGQYNKIFSMIEQHVESRVKAQLDKHPLMNVFESLRPNILLNCLTQALGRAQSLMPFSRGFAATCVEDCYVTACWNNDAQKNMLEEALSQISQKATLKKSDDPTEIVVFYLIDGLAITAINELTSRCLDAFLGQRSLWTRNNSNAAVHGSMRGIPVYSSYYLDTKVRQQGIVHRLYKAKQPSVGSYNFNQVPELADPGGPPPSGKLSESNSSRPELVDMLNNQNGNSQSAGEAAQTQAPPIPQEQNPSAS
jgi:hypothetical protein